MLRKTSAAAAVIAFATAGSALFGGVALAASPNANPDCSGLVNLDASLGVLGQGGSMAKCNATSSSTPTVVVDRGEVEDD